jgi:hypothetical protein
MSSRVNPSNVLPDPCNTNTLGPTGAVVQPAMIKSRDKKMRIFFMINGSVLKEVRVIRVARALDNL